ncbi:hypothetical protein NPIL_330441 [Nephila pilipes]|uniref:Uncharacterized protein n=1 Tax=Nephila pilipes TaxID=299642 RepID=A0A8X6PMV8_NEPPI|nr:hypothetical protein NPIL_83191 [Nephila pilipes]GFT32633.1 hypothetical protein NPIL_408641 [Nephila pilipes]GFT79527.1 hypothetical protein NPIL_563771 [Nephila pilipes]GFU12668.1 hypothetical protein NPIL_330441 [Nephila pilipes]
MSLKGLTSAAKVTSRNELPSDVLQISRPKGNSFRNLILSAWTLTQLIIRLWTHPGRTFITVSRQRALAVRIDVPYYRDLIANSGEDGAILIGGDIAFDFNRKRKTLLSFYNLSLVLDKIR